MARTIALSVVVVAVAVVALVAIGRYERRADIHSAAHAIADVRTTLGPTLLTTRLRQAVDVGGYTCLGFASAHMQPDVGFCFDPSGRLVEATRFRATVTETASVAAYSSAAPSRMSPHLLHELVPWSTTRIILRRLAQAAPAIYDAWCGKGLRHLHVLVRHGRRIDKVSARLAHARCRESFADAVREDLRATPRVSVAWARLLFAAYAPAAATGAAAAAAVAQGERARFEDLYARARVLAADARRATARVRETQRRSLHGAG